MELAAVAVQQAQAQSAIALAVLKANAQAEQALVNMIDQMVPKGSLGSQLDILA